MRPSWRPSPMSSRGWSASPDGDSPCPASAGASLRAPASSGIPAADHAGVRSSPEPTRTRPRLSGPPGALAAVPLPRAPRGGPLLPIPGPGPGRQPLPRRGQRAYLEGGERGRAPGAAARRGGTGGRKQNRILNLSLLVQAHKTLEIPVSCVEQGRWGCHGPAFSASGCAHPASGRARKTRSVSESPHSRGQAFSDQGEVWADIAHKAERMGSIRRRWRWRTSTRATRPGWRIILAPCRRSRGHAGPYLPSMGSRLGWTSSTAPTPSPYFCPSWCEASPSTPSRR